MPNLPAVHGYVLAGGQSARMGTDKALLSFDASTLLERAVAALQLLCFDVTLVGRTRSPSQACRAIPDHVAAAGPLAGIEAALTDLATRGGTWAFFLPIDVPLLPGELLRVLVAHWRANPRTRIAFPIVDGISQPVISLVHVTALPILRQALALNQRRLRPALEVAAAQLANELAATTIDVLQTPTLTVQNGIVWADSNPLAWRPSPRQLQLAALWFANANTPAELDKLRRANAAADI